MSKILKRIFVLITCGCLLAALTIFTILWVFSNNLPDYKFLKNYKAPVSSKVYSGEGELVSDFSSEKRIFVPYNAIPKKVIYAFLSAEDKNFFFSSRVLMQKEFCEQLLIIFLIIFHQKD